MSEIPHHPLIHKINTDYPPPKEDFRLDFIGAKEHSKFSSGEYAHPTQLPPPQFDEEYFEWLDILESVSEAQEEYQIVELGAGFGRWSVRAILALGQLNPLPFRIVAVEAEPTHAEWVAEHFRNNDIDPNQQQIIEAAVSATGEDVMFAVGNPTQWYGQGIVSKASFLQSVATIFRSWSFQRAQRSDDVSVVRVKSVKLSDILKSLDHVDLIDCDIQGAEADVMEEAIESLNAKVRRVHIGTHGPAIETRLRKLFQENGWRSIYDYECGQECETEYGVIDFGDGVQTWRNERN